MTLKHKSDGFKYGDTNPSHVKAIIRVQDFWKRYHHPAFRDWILDVSWVEQYSEKFQKENKMDKSKVRGCFFHTPDIVLFEWHEDRPILKLVIEVDGESHSVKSRKIADGLFKEWINRRYGDVPLIRLQKAELEGPLDLAYEYLAKQLGEFLK